MDLLHNLTPSVSRSSPPPPAFRQATMPVSVAPGQVAPFTCGCQRKLLLFLSVFFFLFFYLLLGFLCCTAAFCHAPQRSTACRMPPSYLQLSPQLFVAYFQGGGKFSHAYCPARGKLCQIECDSLRSVLVNRRRETEKERDIEREREGVRVVVPGRCKL